MQTELTQRLPSQSHHRLVAGAIAAVAVIAMMALDTKVVGIGSKEDTRTQAFSPALYSQKAFPKISKYVLDHAVDAQVLSQAIATDRSAAAKKYGVSAGIGPVIPVSFSGTVGKGQSGIYYVKVDGLTAGQKIRVQTGPAINGTALRDATGTIAFGQFKNQIQYQNVGAAINKTMKAKVLAPLNTKTLTGKQVSVTGVFRLINAQNWLVTPVRFDVK